MATSSLSSVSGLANTWSSQVATDQLTQKARDVDGQKAEQNPELRKVFDSFVGETFFGQMISSMRKTVDKPAYMHGGRAEEVFQGQLDQLLSQRMAEASASQFSGPMIDLMMLPRSN